MSFPPFGTDSVPNGGASYFSYGGGSASTFQSRPLPVSAGAFNGGLLGPKMAPAQTIQQQQRAGFNPVSQNGGGEKENNEWSSEMRSFDRVEDLDNSNQISWRKDSSFSHSSILPQLPSVPGAAPPPSSSTNSHVLNSYSQLPQQSPPPTFQPFVNQNANSSSRQRQATQGLSSQSTFSATNYVPTQPPVNQVKFHRARSSFIPNKWTRGPGDGTFGSIYLSYGGGEFGGKNFGGGPNLSFDRKRPEEIWEEEQERKRAGTTTQASFKKAKKTKKKKKDSRGPAANSKEAQARKLLTRARNQLLHHLSAPSCRLFSEADHVVAVSDDDLDDLLRAGGGDATKVIAHLTEFDHANRKFDNFQELMQAIQEARRAQGDFGAGTEQDEQEPEQHPVEEEKTETVNENGETNGSDAPAESYRSSVVSEDGASAPATGPSTAANSPPTSSRKKGGNTSSRGPTVAEKRAARLAAEEEAKRAAEQQKKANVARASAARASKVAEEKAKREAEAGAATATTPAKGTPKKTAATPAAATASPKKKEESKEADSSAAPATNTEAAKVDDSYAEDFD